MTPGEMQLLAERLVRVVGVQYNGKLGVAVFLTTFAGRDKKAPVGFATNGHERDVAASLRDMADMLDAHENDA